MRFSARPAPARNVLQLLAERFVVAKINAFRMDSRSDDATVVMPRKLLEQRARRAFELNTQASRVAPPSPRDKRDKPEESGPRLTADARRRDTPSSAPLARDIVSPPKVAGPPKMQLLRQALAPVTAGAKGFALVFTLGILIGVLASVRARSNRTAGISAGSHLGAQLVSSVSPSDALPEPESAQVEISPAETTKLAEPSKAADVAPPPKTPIVRHHTLHVHPIAVTPPPPHKTVTGTRPKTTKAATDPASPLATDGATDDLGAANAADLLAREQLDALIR